MRGSGEKSGGKNTGEEEKETEKVRGKQKSSFVPEVFQSNP